MEMSDELIACYVEGKVTPEERNFVRKYLCEHPEEYECILSLIDNDTEDYLGQQLPISADCISMNETSFSDIAYSAAAFAPEQNNLSIHKPKSNLPDVNGIYDRLRRLSDELDK
ncbi:MAG: hypothetical protein IJE18_08560 [Bacteroidaceae bacterium]|nr:hypothetical protein [Bacteroidaceae bacterium]